MIDKRVYEERIKALDEWSNIYTPEIIHRSIIRRAVAILKKDKLWYGLLLEQAKMTQSIQPSEAILNILHT